MKITLSFSDGTESEPNEAYFVLRADGTLHLLSPIDFSVPSGTNVVGVVVRGEGNWHICTKLRNEKFDNSGYFTLVDFEIVIPSSDHTHHRSIPVVKQHQKKSRLARLLRR